ncbi:MAG: dTMP kinase [Anaerolineae bacterium]|jgi:dTMP kinase|nr:dTMP kinase [Anaerolineae bacterium]
MAVTGFLISLSGIDGVGKSTLGHRIQEFLWARYELPSRYVWCKFGKHPLSQYRLSRFVRHDPKENSDTPKRQSQSPSLLTDLYVRGLLAVHLVHIATSVRMPLRQGKIVICDRYIFDTMVDLQQEMSGPTTHIQKALRAAWIPQPDFKFLLDLPEAAAFARKNDTASLGFLRERRDAYMDIATAHGLTIIDAGQPIDRVFERIMEPIIPVLEEGQPHA